MIQHPMANAPEADEAFVFAHLVSWTCSICAPMSWPEARVLLFAEARFGTEGWRSVNPAEVIGGQMMRHRKYPNPCDQAPTLRQHWFLIRSP